MRLTFDEATHTYQLDGKRVPSVTQLIKAILPPQYEFAGEWHMNRGTATHKACELFDQGRLDWSSVDPEIEPRVRAWMNFRQQKPMKIVANEKRLSHEKLLYAGTLDRMFADVGGLTICDLKNSVTPHVRLQLAAYSLLWTANGGGVVQKAVAVELLDNGWFNCHWMTKQELRRAEQQWLAMLTVYNFANEHGLLKGKE